MLSEYSLQYQPRQALKAQVLADFRVEMTYTKDEKKLEDLRWTLFVDRSSSETRYGARILLESPPGVMLEQALTIVFPLITNQAK